jgi:hypothetical protein
LFFDGSSPGTSPGSVDTDSGHETVDPPSTSTSPDIEHAKAISASKRGDTIRLSPSDIFKDIPGKGPHLSEIISPEEARARNDLFDIHNKTPKTPSVAELDGFQVPQQLPSPPPSCPPSPSPLRAKIETSPTKEKRNTHVIRMEIRMKAEKAKQGAAAAKSASDRLKAARKHAERLAEARAAYDKAKAHNATAKGEGSLDELRQQKLNTERINEARKAYKAAKVKEEAEKQPEDIRKEVKKESKKPDVPASGRASHRKIPVNNVPPMPKPSRKSTTKRPSTHQRDNDHNGVGATHAEEHENVVNAPDDLANIALSPGGFYLSLANIHNFLHHNQVFFHIISYCQQLFNMATHCFKVCKRLAEAWLEYKQKGVLPQSCVDDFGQLVEDIGQALINFAVLYFAFMTIVKATGYVVIVANWIVWLTKPVGWIFGRVLDAV